MTPASRGRNRDLTIMVKQDLMIYLAAMAGIGAVLYFAWVCSRDLFYHIVDWRQSKQFDGVRVQREARQRESHEENERRLANGCEHEYDTQFGALPMDVCCKCGLAKEKPAGECDHVWRREKGLIPASRCEKCGQQYGGALAEQSAVDN